jgi:PAS domain S-box-containing protein
LALIASQGTDAVMITDHYVRIEWVNAAFEKISGYRTEEVIGLKPGHFLQGPGTGTDPDAADVIRRAMKARTPVSVELLNYTKDGQPYWLDISMTPVFDKTGELERFIAVERDVTARRQMAEDLSRAPQEARTAREAAEHANAEKSRFLANMSHELRTPLNAVIGYAEILEEELNESGEEACARDAQRIKAGRHLLHLINDVSDLSKIEAGKVELTLGPVDISTLAQEAIDTIGPVASANGNELEVSIDDAVGTAFTDGPKVRQCVLNLLSNAAKFTKNGAVRLHVQREQQAGGDRIVFVVSDSGIGIAPGRIARLFAPFAQADSSIQKRFGGTGLGLAITRSLAQALGGDISVTSVQGQGSTFTLHVAATCEDRIEDVLLEADGDAPVVLVIEDEPCARDLVRRAVARVGFVARGAETGASGLGLAAQIKPAAIVLDIALPDMSGWEVLERLKGDLATRDVPVIVSSVVDGAEEAQRRGAAIFLAKPNERDALVAAILRVARPGEQASLGATLMMEYALDVEVA